MYGRKTAFFLSFLASLLLAAQPVFSEGKEPEIEKASPRGLSSKKPNPVVLMKTSMGDIKIELFQEEAPKTVENFLWYVKEGFYDGTVFHRVISNFMIQGGGFDKNFKRKKTRPPIPNEAKAELKNAVGTIAMARTNDINSATSQFFINVNDNYYLDHKGDKPSEFGYAVFGKVIDGMDVVMAISKVPTGAVGPFQRDCPLEPVIIKSVRLLSSEKESAQEEK